YTAGTPRFSGVPRVVTCLDLVPLVMHRDYLPGRFIYRRVLWMTEALRYHTADRVLAISQHSADEAMQVLGVPARKIDVADLGVVREAGLPALVAGGLAFVCCSTDEGFGNVHLEAMACGTPVITPAVTSMRGSIGDASLVVPPRDVDATADAIRRLAREPAL